MPTALRTALCSSIIPLYCTGMSHPPKSTILAPRARWTEFRGVTRRDGAADMKTQANRKLNEMLDTRCRVPRGGQRLGALGWLLAGESISGHDLNRALASGICIWHPSSGAH